MKNKDDKKKDVESLRKELEASKNIFVTGYEKLRVEQDFELRKTVRASGGKYRVVKNNLAAKASEGTPSEQVLKDLKGMTSLAYTSGDPVALGRRRCALLSGLTGVEAEAIWQWGFIERLANGLLYCEIGPKGHAAEFLTVVEAWAEAEVD